MIDIINKINEFFRSEDFLQNGENAKLSLSPHEARIILFNFEAFIKLKSKLKGIYGLIKE